LVDHNRKEEIDQMIMAVISAGTSKAASKAATSTSPKPTAVKTANGSNKKSVVNDDSDLSDDEMDDKQSDSDDYEVLCLLANFLSL